MDMGTIIDGLRMTMDLFVFDPSTGEERDPDELNDLDKATYDACKGALEILERLDTDSDTISRAKAIDEIKEIYEWHDNVTKERIIEHFKQLPPAQSEIIHCEECLFYEAEDGWCEMHSGYGFWEKAFCSFAKKTEVTT